MGDENNLWWEQDLLKLWVPVLRERRVQQLGAAQLGPATRCFAGANRSFLNVCFYCRIWFLSIDGINAILRF
jgi:hypothetical protein